MRISATPPVISRDAVRAATFHDGHRAIAWDKIEHQPVAIPMGYSINLRPLHLTSP
ncbi:MAG TPA: hypothetical protein VHC86_05535 [Opitutaceae bacterium]|nr:hypothetical protein [Opitutaceae bacterium]